MSKFNAGIEKTNIFLPQSHHLIRLPFECAQKKVKRGRLYCPNNINVCDINNADCLEYNNCWLIHFRCFELASIMLM